MRQLWCSNPGQKAVVSGRRWTRPANYAIVAGNLKKEPPVNVFVRVKAAGKRRDMLERHARSVPDAPETPEKLIAYLVRENVRAYNAKTVDAPFFQYLSRQELEDGEHTGKIGFGDRRNQNNQDEEAAVRDALQCFADGLYRLLVNEDEARPGMPFTLKEGDTLTFIRLVMLAGRRF
jgi:hypothetical protein